MPTCYHYTITKQTKTKQKPKLKKETVMKTDQANQANQGKKPVPKVIRKPLCTDFAGAVKVFQLSEKFMFYLNREKSLNPNNQFFAGAVVFEALHENKLAIQIADHRKAVVNEYDRLSSINSTIFEIVGKVREKAFGKKDETTKAIINAEMVISCDKERSTEFLSLSFYDVSATDDEKKGLLTLGVMSVPAQISTKKGETPLLWLFGKGLSGRLDETNTVQKTDGEKALFALLTKDFPFNARITSDNNGSHICAELGYDFVYKRTELKTLDQKKEVSAAIKKAEQETTPLTVAQETDVTSTLSTSPASEKTAQPVKKEKTVKKKPAPQKV
jgi:hypothetical protein